MKFIKQGGVLLYSINSGFTMRVVLRFHAHYFLVRLSSLLTNNFLLLDIGRYSLGTLISNGCWQ